jgi:hypothetical protein
MISSVQLTMYNTKMLSQEKDLNSKILIHYSFNGWSTIRTELVFLNFYGAQESIPGYRFRQPM